MNVFFMNKIDNNEIALKNHQEWEKEYRIAKRNFFHASYYEGNIENLEYETALDRVWNLRNDKRKLKVYQLRAIERGDFLEGVRVQYVTGECRYHGKTQFSFMESSEGFKETKICLKCCDKKREWAYEAFIKDMRKQHKAFRGII